MGETEYFGLVGEGESNAVRQKEPSPQPSPIGWERENRRQSFEQSDIGLRFMVPITGISKGKIF